MPKRLLLKLHITDVGTDLANGKKTSNILGLQCTNLLSGCKVGRKKNRIGNCSVHWALPGGVLFGAIA